MPITTKSTLSLSFFLRREKASSDQKAPIYLRIVVSGSRNSLATHRKVLPSQWDARIGRQVKGAGASELNSALDAIRNEFLSIYEERLRGTESVTAHSLKQAYQAPSIYKPPMLLELVREHNQEMQALVGKKFSAGTLKNYRTSLRTLEEFLRVEYQKPDIPIAEIQYAFLSRLERFLLNRSCTQNGAMKHLQRLRKLLNYAIRRDLLDQNPFRKYPLSFKRVDRGYLSASELELLQKTKLQKEHLNKVRRWFLLACYTGLPYADLKALEWSNIVRGIDDALWIKIKRQKTGVLIQLPLLPKALKLLPKRQEDNRVFEVYSNQKVNTYLKEIAVECGLKKHLTFHMARHTFATTITLLHGVPIETVSKMLGHTKLATTQIYGRILEQRISQDMLKLKALY